MDIALYLHIVALLYTTGSEEVSDPCMDGQHKELHRGKYRGTMCPFNPQKPVCDRNIKAGWYKVMGEYGPLQMPDTNVRVSYCGTNYPIWMNGE
ncbi:hypothetical protein CHS0354_013569 [Potamilus streckersoni]|uniref:Uncharacterized protein n=1 Tax=Potamilus streckersoni TaxID=2493646 RepID=A0AAE0SL17_9BIVA|nr:hypothetical protein CHS0354_013569 [Potamilus streckersoni]